MKHGVLRFASLCALLSTVACGSSDDGSTTDPVKDPPSNNDDKTSQTANFPEEMLPDELVPDLPLVAPKSELEIPIFTQPVDIEPGADVTFCTYSNVILEEDTIFAESYGAQSPMGHHAILQYTRTPVEPGTGPCGEGDMSSDILLGGTGGKTVKDTGDLPANFGIEVPAGAQLVMNHHWINTSDKAVRGQSMMLARKLERGGDTVLAGNMIMIGFGWEIPAQSKQTYATECEVQSDVSLVMALGHMHEYGSKVTIDVAKPTGEVASMIDRVWTADEATGASGQEIYSIEEPYMLNKGDKVTLTCNWENTTDSALAFPREMCVFFGYTVGSSNFCFNGTWMDGDAAKAAGLDEVVDNL
jgi:hypothetical protein